MESIILISLLLLNLLLITAVLLFVVWLVQSLIFRAPFLPLPKPVVEKVVQQSNLSEQDIFYDLGSGDGRVVRAMARQYPFATCYGVEIAILPCLIAWLMQKTSDSNNVFFIRKDYRKVSLKQVKVVFLYLFPGAMQEISAKLQTELPAGAQIISCRFELPDFILLKTEIIEHKGYSYKFYQYTKTL